MNRRNLLKGLLGLGGVAVAGKAGWETAEHLKGYEGEVTDVSVDYEAKYWDAQNHIDALYDEPQVILETVPNNNLRVYNATGDYAELRHDGTNFVIENSVTGRKIVV